VLGGWRRQGCAEQERGHGQGSPSCGQWSPGRWWPKHRWGALPRPTSLCWLCSSLHSAREIPGFLLIRPASCCGSPVPAPALPASRLCSATVLKRQFLAPASHSRAPQGGQPSQVRHFTYKESRAYGFCCCFSRKLLCLQALLGFSSCVVNRQ